MLDSFLAKIRSLIPKGTFDFLSPAYHLTLSWVAAFYYNFPSRRLKIIAVTGTKGKSSTTEILNAILETAGKKTALSNTIRFKIGESSQPNLHKMSMPGRFFLQKLIWNAAEAGCTHMIVEMTSQGALQYRHRFIELDTLIFTNLSPEHIEAHGSYEAYREAKLAIARNMARSRKPVRVIIANADDIESEKFTALAPDTAITYSIHDIEPYEVATDGVRFAFAGRPVRSALPGLFNLYNIIAAITAAEHENVSLENIIKGVESLDEIPGRVEEIKAGQDFTVIVDYAHTPDSLGKLYRVFRPEPSAIKAEFLRQPPDMPHIIAVLGGTGGGRDSWKRGEMGRLADTYCDSIILTDEDPYDEDPRKIVDDVAKGIVVHKPTIIMDRREAIREAMKQAQKGDIVIITGKGTDPFIMGPKGLKTPWSDAKVAREEVMKIIEN